MGSTSTSSSSTSSSSVIQQQQSVPLNEERIGVMYICWSKGCDLRMLCASVTSLRRAGGWQGQVFVLTDNVQQVDESRLSCFGEENRDRDATNRLYQTVQAPEAGHQMLMKDWKRQMFDLLPGNLSTAIYVDVDNFVVGCFEDFLLHHMFTHEYFRDQIPVISEGSTNGDAAVSRVVLDDSLGTTNESDTSVTPRDKQREGKIYMLPDNVCIGCNAFNGGFMVVKKGSLSNACLQEWLEETAKDDHRMYVKDQVALDNVLKRNDNSCIHGIEKIPYREELYMDAMIIPSIIRLYSTHRTPTLQHFTSGIRRSWIWNHIIASIERQLKSLEI